MSVSWVPVQSVTAPAAGRSSSPKRRHPCHRLETVHGHPMHITLLLRRKTIHPYVSIKYLEYAMKAKAEERESVYMNTHQGNVSIGKSIYAIKPRATSFLPLPEPHKALVVTRSNSASILSSACPCTFWASRDLLWHYPLTAPHTVPATLKRSLQSRSLETPAQSALCIPSSWKSSTHSGAIR